MKKSRNAYVLTLMYQKKILKNTGRYANTLHSLISDPTLLYIAFCLLIHVFVNYRLALVQNSRAHYLEEENIDAVRLKDFQITSGPTQGPQQNHNHHARPFIGLQHANKNSKRARYNYMEKPIKIYN